MKFEKLGKIRNTSFAKGLVSDGEPTSGFFKLQKIRTWRKIVFLFFLIFLLPGNDISAYTITKVDITPQNDFVVEPGKTEVFLDPGQNMIKNISVINRVERTVHFKLSTEDFVGTDDYTQPVVLLGDEYSPYSLKDLIVPEITEFSLEYGEKITIPVSISVPLNAEPRGYYGALIISNDPNKIFDEEGNEIVGRTRIVSRIGSLFLLKINGEGREEGRLEEFKTVGPKKLFYGVRPEGFEVAYKNTGNVHLVPYGTITIKNIFGHVVEILPVDAYFVLPESIRYREIAWKSGFSVGRYTAELSLFRGYNEDFLDEKISFFVIPWKILIPIFIFITLIVGLFYYIMTRFELKRK